MSFEEKLFTMLKNEVSLVNNRVFAVVAPQDAKKPYIVYTVETDMRDYTHDGFSGLSRPQVQINCYSETYHEAKGLANSVTLAMEGWTGSDNVQAVFLQPDSPSDFYEMDTDLFFVLKSFLVWHKN